MYEELVKMLRTCAERDSCIGWRETCPYLGTGVCDNKAEKAADAIEELSKRVPKAPHGRLIDADALVRDNGIKEIPEYYEVVCDAPTIIPAEEGEK